jgi:hypothetical protein
MEWGLGTATGHDLALIVRPAATIPLSPLSSKAGH